MQAFFPYSATTAGITVRVNPTYLEDHSDPDEDHYVWSYHIRIENAGERDAQLIARHWIITDARGRVEEIRGEGVVGDQPLIEPGGSYDYVSGCPLSTPSGTMEGTYAMAAEGELFEIAIPLFSLDSPTARTSLN